MQHPARAYSSKIYSSVVFDEKFVKMFKKMKAIIEFNLPEEQYEHQSALLGASALAAIDDILEEIRSKLKYGSGYFEGCDNNTLEKVRFFIIELKQERLLP